MCAHGSNPWQGTLIPENRDDERGWEMPKYDNAKLIHKETGEEIKPGDTVPDFRGEPQVFEFISRLPEGNSEGKIIIKAKVGGEVYPSVLNARIEVPAPAPATKEYTPEEFKELVLDYFGEDQNVTGDGIVFARSVTAQMNKWLERGDGVAVYENHDLGHPEVGTKKFISYGSSVAQLETDTPPNTLPDIGSQINWRYALIGTYKGDPISV